MHVLRYTGFCSDAPSASNAISDPLKPTGARCHDNASLERKTQKFSTFLLLYVALNSKLHAEERLVAHAFLRHLPPRHVGHCRGVPVALP